MRTPIYVLGGYQTDFARSYARDGLDISDMMREAIEGALADSGLDAEDIETVHVGHSRNYNANRATWAQWHRKWFLVCGVNQQCVTKVRARRRRLQSCLQWQN
jgi:acetyl-CoA acetyltransferase